MSRTISCVPFFLALVTLAACGDKEGAATVQYDDVEGRIAALETDDTVVTQDDLAIYMSSIQDLYTQVQALESRVTTCEETGAAQQIALDEQALALAALGDGLGEHGEELDELDQSLGGLGARVEEIEGLSPVQSWTASAAPAEIVWYAHGATEEGTGYTLSGITPDHDGPLSFGGSLTVDARGGEVFCSGSWRLDLLDSTGAIVASSVAVDTYATYYSGSDAARLVFDDTLVDVTGDTTYTIELVVVTMSGGASAACDYLAYSMQGLLLPGM